MCCLSSEVKAMNNSRLFVICNLYSFSKVVKSTFFVSSNSQGGHKQNWKLTHSLLCAGMGKVERLE